MNSKTLKKFFLELKINNNLADIENYTNNAYYLLINEDNDEVNKVEIIDCLSCIPSIIKTIEEVIEKWALEYETEIEEIKCKGGYVNEE